ncbi:hypothetical protein Tco_1280115 [Tanacetum coccineum]
MESLNSNLQERELHQLQQMQDKAKESCMTSFQLLLSFLQVLSYDESKSKRVSERAFMTLFGQDNETFTSTMFLYVDQLLNHLDKDEFQEDKSMAAFWYDKDEERQMQLRESKVVSSKALDASLVVTECSGTKLDEHITSISSGTYITHVVDTNIRPVNDQVPSAKVDSNTTPDSTNMCHKGGEIDQDAEQYKEKVFANASLKNKLRKLNGTSVDTKFAKPSTLGKLVLQPHINQSVVRQPNAFKSERPNFSKSRFASQVDVINVLSKPVTPHYLLVKPHHVITPGSSRNSQEEYYGSNDMAHNHYLEEARKKTQEINRNSKPSVMPSVRLQNTANGSTPNHKRTSQTSRSLPSSKSSCVTITVVPKADHSRNSSSFSDSKHFFCSTCHKCVFNANHDACITKLLNEVNSRHRWIPTGKMFIDSTTKVDSEPPNGSNEDITNPYECNQTLNVSACTLNLSADNTSGPAPQRKEKCTIQCALSLKEEKSSFISDCNSLFNLRKAGHQKDRCS